MPTNETTRALPERQPAPPDGAERELSIDIYPGLRDTWKGTRAQLEAEGIINLESEWPRGTCRYDWEVNGLHFSLKRIAPPGPRTNWSEGDYWAFCRENLEKLPSYGDRLMELKKEMATEIWHQTPAGQAMFTRYRTAQDDAIFQAFKAKLMPEKKKPGRPSKSA